MTALACLQILIADGTRNKLSDIITQFAATTAIADPPAPIAIPTDAANKIKIKIIHSKMLFTSI
jgi:hypothetical protein